MRPRTVDERGAGPWQSWCVRTTVQSTPTGSRPTCPREAASAISPSTKVCINIYDGFTYAQAYVPVENTGYGFGAGIVFINSGGKYYNFANCNPPSHTVIQNFECSTALSQGSINGYVQGQIRLGINYAIYKAFSLSEPFQ